MAGGWDPSLVDPTDVIFDGLILRSVGGRTGEVTLENGQKIRFPWKAQQEVTGSVPPRIQAYETDNPGVEHKLVLSIDGAGFPGMTTYPGMQLESTFADDVSGLAGVRGEPTLVLYSGGLTGSDSCSIQLQASATGNGDIALNGDVTIPASTGSLKVDTIANTVGAMTITSSEDLTISTSGAGDTILIDSADTLTLNSAGLMTLQPDANQNLALTTTGTGDVNITAGDDINLAATGDVVIDSGSSAVVTANAGNDRAVRANGYPLVPLRNVGTAISGTAPAVSDAAPAYKFQAGKATVTFTAGAGTLTFPTAFATGLLACLVTSGGSDAVVDVTMGSSTKTSAALTLYIAGAAATGGADVTYIAIGW